MFSIEKNPHSTSLNTETYAMDKSKNHHWFRAWPNDKSYIDSGLEAAIVEFYKRTSKVRSTAYRLVDLDSYSVVAAINTNDTHIFDKFRIHAVGFTDQFNGDITSHPSRESFGSVIPYTGGVIAGASSCKQSIVETQVNLAAKLLHSNVSTHRTTIRFNSNGLSGGAYLVTDLYEGILSNCDVGISYYGNRKKFVLSVSNKFLSDSCYGNSRNPFTRLIDHESEHGTAEEAYQKLQEVVSHATPKQTAVLLA